MFCFVQTHVIYATKDVHIVQCRFTTWNSIPLLRSGCFPHLHNYHLHGHISVLFLTPFVFIEDIPAVVEMVLDGPLIQPL